MVIINRLRRGAACPVREGVATYYLGVNRGKRSIALDLREEGDAVLFYAGSKSVTLYRSETERYRDNLATGSPSLWVVLSPTEGEWPYTLTAVTATAFGPQAS